VGGPIAHGPGDGLRQSLLQQLQGEWTRTAWGEPLPEGPTFSLSGEQARATVAGTTTTGTLSVRAASTNLLLVDLATDDGKAWIAIVHFYPDGTLKVELREPSERDGWTSHGASMFGRPSP
jgi:hypothetical protein